MSKQLRRWPRMMLLGIIFASLSILPLGACASNEGEGGGIEINEGHTTTAGPADGATGHAPASVPQPSDPGEGTPPEVPSPTP